MAQSSNSIKKLSLELGGNAPFIVFDDADLDIAIKEVVVAKFKSSGQTCVCANRIYVQRGIHDEFLLRLTKAVESFKLGPASSSDSTHGPLIAETAVEKVQELVADATNRGAKVVLGGKRRSDLGMKA